MYAFLRSQGFWLWAALASGVLFVIVTVLNRSGATASFDREVLVGLRAIRAPILESLGALDDIVFRPTPTFAVALIMAVALALRRRGILAAAPLFIGLTGLIEFLVKHPWSRGLHFGDLISATQELVGGHYHGAAPYPSGHVARAMFLGTVAAALLPRWLAVPIAALALTTPLARMYTEAHRLSDVVGGTTLGLFTAALAIIVTRMAATLRSSARTAERG